MKSSSLYFFMLKRACVSATVIFLAITSMFCFPQQEMGLYYHQHFPPKLYKAHSQNWAMAQDSRGILYFGNSNGLLIFNGNHWHLLQLPNMNLVRSIALDNNEVLYVGGFNELGYIKPGNFGKFEFVSLLDRLPEEYRDFGHIRKIHFLEEAVVFHTAKGLYIYKTGKFTVIPWPHESRNNLSFNVKGEIWVNLVEEGLFRLNNNVLVPIEGGTFYKNKMVTCFLPYQKDQWLVGTLYNGLFLFDGINSIPFKTSINNFLMDNHLYSALKMNDTTFIFGTLLKGLVVMDNNGGFVEAINKKNGLGDDAVYGLNIDAQGGLWAMHSYGISRLERHVPLTVFDDRTGLEGAVNDIIRYNNELYVATMLGLYKLLPATLEKSSSFVKIQEITSTVWGMTMVGNSLLFSTDLGTYELNKGKIKQLDNISGAGLHLYKKDSSRLFVILVDGIAVLKNDKGWRLEGKINGLNADVAEIKEDNNGNIWLGTFSEGVFLLQFKTINGKIDFLNPDVHQYGVEHSLPAGYVNLNTLDDRVLFRSDGESNLYRFDFDKKQFTIDDEINKNLKIPSDIILCADEKDSVFWLKVKKENSNKYDLLRITTRGNNYRTQEIEVDRVIEDAEVVFYDEMNGIAWYGGLEGLIRHCYEKETRVGSVFPTNITQVEMGTDSIAYFGAGTVPYMEIPYRNNTLHFQYAAAFFDAPSENEYQYKLEGFDDDWSMWTKENSKEYTKIREGKYVFKVRSRNIYGEIGETTNLSFEIYPPMHRHPIAYLFYVLMLASALWGFVKLRSKKLIKDKQALEKMVKERTEEIVVKNKLLEQQAEELETQADQLKDLDRIKSNFFANISHEFRTPLSLIISPLEKMMASSDNKELTMMYRNTKRLHELIDQLLDLSKLESGQMKVNNQLDDVVGFIKVLLSSFNSLADDKNINFQKHLPDKPIHAFFDKEKLEIVINNLLSNAFKFTPKQGEVKVLMEVNNESIKISVSDTGPGISEDDFDKIFDRFYQVDSSSMREFEGSGIGLALTKELVHLMKGQIHVKSRLNEGTQFMVELPLIAGENDEIKIDSAELAKYFLHDSIPNVSITNTEINPSKERTSVILLVEDNSDMREYLKGIVQQEYKVLTATNGEEGLSLAISKLPDLIISDMMMPKMDGFSLCEKIRLDERTCHIPFILLTAKATVESRLAGLELGADEYLTKPFHVKEVMVRIQNLLEQREMLRKRFAKEILIKPNEVTATSMDERFLLKVMDLMEENLSNPQFSVEKFSEEMGMSRKNLHRKLIALTDQAPGDLIRSFRLKRAANLLESKAGNVSEVAYQVGFNNLSYFSKCFKEMFGVLPNEFLQKQQ